MHGGTNALNESQEGQGRSVRSVRRLGVDSQTRMARASSSVRCRHVGTPEEGHAHTNKTKDVARGRVRTEPGCKLQRDKATTS